MDEIYIKGLKIFAYHGVNPEETENGQEFELDVTMYANLNNARTSDDLDDTVSYSAARKVINAAMTNKPYKLIEKAAEVVATSLLNEFSKLEKVEITLKKPNAPMSGVFDWVGVKISKHK